MGWGAGEKPDRVCGVGEECLSFQVLGRSQARSGGGAAGEARKVMAGIAGHLLGTTERTEMYSGAGGRLGRSSELGVVP